jgi:hypothetical protein
MTSFFRWMIGAVLMLSGLFLFLAWGASLHAGPVFQADEPSHWLVWTLILCSCGGSLLVITKGWPLGARR